MAHDSSAGNDIPATERRGGIVNAVTDWQGQGPDRHFLTTWKLLWRAKTRAHPAMPVFLPGVKPLVAPFPAGGPPAPARFFAGKTTQQGRPPEKSRAKPCFNIFNLFVFFKKSTKVQKKFPFAPFQSGKLPYLLCRRGEDG